MQRLAETYLPNQTQQLDRKLKSEQRTLDTSLQKLIAHFKLLERL